MAADPTYESDGLTASERYLGRLARRSFLSLWSYSNLFTDEGRRGGRGDGKELANLIVVFDKHVLLFSDKHCEFPRGEDIRLSWSRWYRRAVEKSSKQLLGARKWLQTFPGRVFLDRSCQMPFPLTLPGAGEAKYHLIAVTRGAYAACQSFFGSAGSGSLMLDSSVQGKGHYNEPFVIGQVCPGEQYIHVLDEMTLDVQLRHFDTVSDFVAYLDRKEELLSNLHVVAPGEEELIARYMTKLDPDGEHGFDVRDGGTQHLDGVYFEEGGWSAFIKSGEYAAKWRADEESYAWDRLIEHLIALADVEDTERNQRVATLEPALRVLAAETRLARRQLASQLLGALNTDVPAGQRFVRLGTSSARADVAYVFLILPQPPSIATYEEYRQARRALLLAACKVAKLRSPKAQRVVGIASEPRGTKGGSQDLVLLNVSAGFWGAEEEDEARAIQREGMLQETTTKQYLCNDEEFPIVKPKLRGTPAQRLIERTRLKNLGRVQKRSGRA
jgi:hypothetical protein